MALLASFFLHFASLKNMHKVIYMYMYKASTWLEIIDVLKTCTLHKLYMYMEK